MTRNKSQKFEGRKGHRKLTHGGGKKRIKKMLANRKIRHQNILQGEKE